MNLSFASLFLIFAAAVQLSACGSPYVKGWGDEKTDSRTDLEKCEARDGYSWIGESCQDDASVPKENLTKDQCEQIAGSLWLDERCTMFSALTEDQCARAANPDWTYYLSQCMLVKEAACLQADPENTYVDGKCLKLPPGPPPPVDTAATGFLDLCKNPPDNEVNRTVSILIAALEKTDCDAAAKALADVTKLDLTGADLVDLSPLAGLAKLQTIYLVRNEHLTDLKPLATLPGLVELDLRNTAVADLTPLATHAKLSFLLLNQTPLDRDPKTADNCPTGQDVNRAVRLFCQAASHPD